jgi:uncharacterized membrane protein
MPFPSSFKPAVTNTLLDSFIFLFFSMILIAASLYLPQHIAFLTSRAWFYYTGDSNESVAAIVTATATAITDKIAKVTNINVPGLPEGLIIAGRKPGSAKGWANKAEL